MSTRTFTLLQLFLLLHLLLAQTLTTETPSSVLMSNIVNTTGENMTTSGDKDIDYYVLTRKIGDNMYGKYKLRIPEVKFVCHHKPKENHIKKKDLIWYPNSIFESRGFHHLHSFKKTCSWDILLFHFSRSKGKGFHWVIEDDVYISADSRSVLDSYDNDQSDLIIFGWRKEYIGDHRWPHWGLNKHGYFNSTELGSTLNTIIRCSSRLIEKALEYHRTNGAFIFHEILFYSLCKKHKYSVRKVNDKRIKCHALANRGFRTENKNYTIKHPFKLWFDNPAL